MNETFSNAALLVGVLRTLLNVSMFSHFRASAYLNSSSPNSKLFLGTSINFPLRFESVIFTC